MNTYDYLVVGSGFYGSVITERLRAAGKSVLIVERRDHIGGNCYSYEYEGHDIQVHKYGTHIFHTSNRKVWEYITGFGEFNRYQHIVLTTYKNKVFSLPINLGTINSFYDLNLKPYEVEEFISGKRGNFSNPTNLEEKAISLIGKDLYEALIKGYTTKQWGREPDSLPSDIITRLPVRKSYRNSYFDDVYQGIPIKGYTELFKEMLKGVPIELGADFLVDREYWQKRARHIIYTGPIDRYFDFVHGKLSWRSVRFEIELIEIEDYQGTSVMNYADLEVPYTRIHEPRHLHPENNFRSKSTVIIREYPIRDDAEPYYPVNSIRDKEIYRKYLKESKNEAGVFFGGRLAEYKYYDMHHVIDKALKDYSLVLAC
jgi:UDP-galactopyranose mutase